MVPDRTRRPSDRDRHGRLRGTVRGLSLLAGLLLAANAAWLAATANFNLGVVLQAATAAALIGYGLSRRLSGSRWLNLVGGGLGIIVLGASGLLAGYGLADTVDHTEDALIVLGAAVHGREVSPALAARLDVAVGYHQRNPDALIVVSGAQGPQEDVPEAVAMRDYLLARGVPDDRIVGEDRATSTAENFAFSVALLDARLAPGYRVGFVTSEFHVWRASATAARAGLATTHLHSATRWYVWPASYLREVVAVAQFVIAQPGFTATP